MVINIDQIHFQSLRSIIAERTSPVIIWCGAGLSTEAGLPGWKKLKDLIIQDYEKECDGESKTTLDSIKIEKDLWVSFSRLKELMQNTTFSAYIRKYLDVRTDPPTIYEDIWKLCPRGVITLNLDRFASLGYNKVNPNAKMYEFEGFSINDNYRLLKGPDQFIVNMHGVIEKNHTWVFTKEELSALKKKEGYNEFITTLFSAFTVVFVGISADDLGAGSILYNLVYEKQIDLGTHFWITDRKEEETRKWAEKSGIGIIKYSNGIHNEVREYILDIIGFIPEDEDPPPIMLKSTNDSIFNDNNLSREDANTIRMLLNNESKRIMAASNNDYNEYFRFLDKYDEECHRAWYIGKTPEKRKIFNYQIVDELGSGSFGTVYIAHDDCGKQVAIKILHENIRNQRDKLKCFRRGVKSLKILNTNGIENIVKLIDASEIPLMIVMQYINGPNLKVLKEMKQCDTWETVLELFYQCSSILVKSHSLPERVLHRDLRPTNILLDDYFSCGEIHVIICDFDFSWHKDAVEDSINRSPNGYLAPEQIEKDCGFSSRSSLVDSFGLGMNLYFMLSGKQPSYKLHLQKDWDDILKEACLSIKQPKWISLPYRVFRLIRNITNNDQNKRWDLSQINIELHRVKECLLNESSSYSELLAEEFFARVVGQFSYEVNNFAYEYRYSNGLEFSLKFDELAKNIQFDISYGSIGSESHSNILKYLPSKKDKVVSLFRSTKWKVISEQVSRESMKLSFIIANSEMLPLLQNTPKTFKDLKVEFNFN